MVKRRAFLIAGLSSLAIPDLTWAEQVTDLDWEDLLPEGTQIIPNGLRGLIDHDGPDLSDQQPISTGVRNDWNGQIVRLPGFILPIDMRDDGVTAFILVPYVGACVHVPPPPANQLVFVTTETPYPTTGLYEPVNVTGMFGTASTSTQLAEVGYALSAEKIEPFKL